MTANQPARKAPATVAVCLSASSPDPLCHAVCGARGLHHNV
jgi:hypothetical protein